MNLRTFEATLWTWRHHEHAQQLVEASEQEREGGVGPLSVGTGPIPETSDAHERIAIERPNRWRIDGTEQIDVSRADAQWPEALQFRNPD